MSRAQFAPTRISILLLRVRILEIGQPEAIPVEVARIDRKLMHRLGLDVRLVGEHEELGGLSGPFEARVKLDDKASLGFG